MPSSSVTALTPAIRRSGTGTSILLDRLAEYKYYNTDAIVALALELCRHVAEKGA